MNIKKQNKKEKDEMMEKYLTKGGKITHCKPSKPLVSLPKCKDSTSYRGTMKRALQGYKSYKQLLKDEENV